MVSSGISDRGIEPQASNGWMDYMLSSGTSDCGYEPRTSDCSWIYPGCQIVRVSVHRGRPGPRILVSNLDPLQEQELGNTDLS